MPNSTTSWQESVRLRMYQKAMAKCPESFDTPTLDNYLVNDPISLEIINDNDHPTCKKILQVHTNPDGQDHLIRGKYAEVLKNDPHLLQARVWGVYPGVLTKAIVRMGLEWTQKQVAYVQAEIKANHGAYLARILLRNRY